MENQIIGGADILSLGASMLIVVAAVVALGWLYTRFRFSGNGSGDAINIIASRALGPKERLLLVEVADQQLLVGLTAGQLSTLHTFEHPVSVQQVSGDVSGFAERLRSAVRGRAK